MASELQIIEKPDWVSWDAIHEVLWASHEQNRQAGIYMKYPSLPGEEIRKRIEGHGKMFVAILDGNLVGSSSVKVKKMNLWCGKGDYAYECFASVLPGYSGHGIYRRLYEAVEQEGARMGLRRFMFDSHEDNKRIADIHIKAGYVPVSYKQYGDHNSIVFVKWLDGRPYSDFRCKLQYFLKKTEIKTRQRLHALRRKILSDL